MLSSWPKQWQSSFTNVDDLLKYLELSRLDLPILTDFTQFPFKVPRPFVDRMKKGDPNDPLLLQVLPITAELLENPGFSKNPLQEDTVNPVSGLLHKYSSRVLLTLSGSCAINCRYCFRRHFPYEDNNPGTKGWESIFDYLREHSEVNEVILSGGDPLSTNDAVLKRFIQRLERFGVGSIFTFSYTFSYRDS
ncbi:MAG: 4Fe-4S cluster-binding domain-containing protein [Gammaproteobacteria bacterium]|nr:4Fe-4S cluster-binding domain-containing protein [Gammaproteobacteria bacterium]